MNTLQMVCMVYT